MFNSAAIPQSPVQKFINILANSEVGEVLTDPNNFTVVKKSHNHVSVDGRLMLVEDYLSYLQGTVKEE